MLPAEGRRETVQDGTGIYNGPGLQLELITWPLLNVSKAGKNIPTVGPGKKGNSSWCTQNPLARDKKSMLPWLGSSAG